MVLKAQPQENMSTELRTHYLCAWQSEHISDKSNCCRPWEKSEYISTIAYPWSTDKWVGYVQLVIFCHISNTTFRIISLFKLITKHEEKNTSYLCCEGNTSCLRICFRNNPRLTGPNWYSVARPILTSRSHRRRWLSSDGLQCAFLHSEIL